MAQTYDIHNCQLNLANRVITTCLDTVSRKAIFEIGLESNYEKLKKK